MSLDLLCNKVVGVIVLAYYESPRSILVNPVNDTGTLLTIDAGQGILTVEKDRVYECIVSMSGSGMNHHSLCFVDYQDIIILIKDIKGKLNRLNIDLF